MRHRFFIGIDPLKCKKQINMLSASYLTFRRANLSLMGCTSAEPVSVRSKVQRIKLYLHTVEIPNHFQILQTLGCFIILGCSALQQVFVFIFSVLRAFAEFD